jgi:hypothetical protein
VSRWRACVGSTLALALAPVVFANASSTPTATHNCGHLEKDPRGDARLAIVPTNPYDPEADVLYVDAVPTAKAVDFTVTMASVAAHPVTATDLTIAFSVGQRAGGYGVDITHAADGDSFVLQSDASTLTTPLTGTSDPTHGTYLVQVPLAVILAKRGTPLYGLDTLSSEDVGPSAANVGFTADSTDDSYQYRIGYSYGCRRH